MDNQLTNIIIPKYKLNYNVERNKNIIQASLDKNIKLPFSCRSGVCGTCKAKVLRGEVVLNSKINHVLTEFDKENNIILTCQAEAKSDLLELEILSPVIKCFISYPKNIPDTISRIPIEIAEIES